MPYGIFWIWNCVGDYNVFSGRINTTLERGENKMEQILKRQDLQLLRRKVPNELLSYLEQEFNEIGMVVVHE